MHEVFLTQEQPKNKHCHSMHVDTPAQKTFCPNTTFAAAAAATSPCKSICFWKQLVLNPIYDAGKGDGLLLLRSFSHLLSANLRCLWAADWRGTAGRHGVQDTLYRCALKTPWKAILHFGYKTCWIVNRKWAFYCLETPLSFWILYLDLYNIFEFYKHYMGFKKTYYLFSALQKMHSET